MGLLALFIEPALMIAGWMKHTQHEHRHDVLLMAAGGVEQAAIHHAAAVGDNVGAVRGQKMEKQAAAAAGAALGMPEYVEAAAGDDASPGAAGSKGGALSAVRAKKKGAKIWSFGVSKGNKLSVQNNRSPPPAARKTQPDVFKKPIQRLPRNHTISAVGVVFYGRRSRTKILNCYLERNLERNGGILKEVVFVVATWDQEDLNYLNKLLAAHPFEYRKVIPERWDKGYTGHYAWMDNNTHYFKLDDDVTFIDDNTMDLMMEAYLEHKYFLISANVINHQPLEWPHSLKKAHFNVSKTLAGKWSVQEDTPFFDNGWDVWGSWERAMNVHYSFLHNIRNNNLAVYDFPNNERYFNFNQYFGYTRWRINLITFMGKDIDVHTYNMSSTVETYPGDDEDWITRLLPQKLKKQSAAISKAYAVHFSFYPQREGLEKHTDLLDQYANLAREICGPLIEP